MARIHPSRPSHLRFAAGFAAEVPCVVLKRMHQKTLAALFGTHPVLILYGFSFPLPLPYHPPVHLLNAGLDASRDAGCWVARKTIPVPAGPLLQVQTGLPQP